MDIGMLLCRMYEQCETVEECDDLFQEVENMNEAYHQLRVSDIED